MDATLRYHHFVGWHSARKRVARLEARLKSMQIPVINAYQWRTECKRKIELCTIMHLNQHIEAKRLGIACQVSQRRCVQRSDDEQHTVGTHSARRGNLIAVDNKIFANDRNRAGTAGGNEVIVMALKVVAIGQHRQTSRAVGCVIRRVACRVEVGANEPFRRRRLLDFGDYRRLFARDTRHDSVGKTADGIRFSGERLHVGEAQHAFVSFDFAMFGGDNLL